MTSSLIAREIIDAKPDDEADFDALKRINDDIVAWISIDSTAIDYPVLQGDDNNWYLDHNYLGNYAIGGSIFMDYRNEIDDDFIIIYGHRMSGKLMFSEIGNYASTNYFREHRKGEISFDGARTEFEVLAYREVKESSILYNLEVRRNGQNEEVLAEFFDEDTAKLGARYSQLVLLSTCSRNSKNLRSVLLLGL